MSKKKKTYPSEQNTPEPQPEAEETGAPVSESPEEKTAGGDADDKEEKSPGNTAGKDAGKPEENAEPEEASDNGAAAGKDKPDERILAQVKCNVGPTGNAITFSVKDGQVEWLNETSKTADEVLGNVYTGKGRPDTQLQAAKDLAERMKAVIPGTLSSTGMDMAYAQISIFHDDLSITYIVPSDETAASVIAEGFEDRAAYKCSGILPRQNINLLPDSAP